MFQNWLSGQSNTSNFSYSDPFSPTNIEDFEDCLKYLEQKQPNDIQQIFQPSLIKQSSNNYQVETNFEDEIKVILINEGGYSNKKSDRGGETNRGITQTTYNNFQKKYPTIIKSKSVKDLELSEVKEFYKLYIKDCKADQITNKSNRIQFADAAVHHGGENATRLAQRVLGLTADGLFGPNTRNALNNADPIQFRKKFIQVRRELCAILIQKKPDQKANEKGWKNRLDRMENL